jgi:aspartyl-tRNA(Asn)/glutamyl-tRNA(Gln) amidotransferase subunit A
VPFGVKDLENARGLPTTHGSLFHKNAAPAQADSIHVARLRAAGAIPLGKTAAAEFGMDSITATKAWGVTRNPWNTALTPGGSSGGSAAAVAAGMIPMGTSSDGGGSTRAPAAFTNLVGHKPSHGRIPRNSESLFSVLGALTTTVADTARYLDVAAGPHPLDRMSLPRPPAAFEELIETLDVAGLRAAWSPDYGYAVMDPEMVDIVRDAGEALIAAARLRRSDTVLSLPNIRPLWAVLNASRAWASLVAQGFLPDRLDEMSDRPGAFMRRGAAVTLAEFHACEQSMASIHAAFGAFFADVDVLLSPAVACPAFAAAGPAPVVISGQDASGTGVEPIGFVANACWNPAISVPAGLTAAGLPVGLMITTRNHRDDIALRLARIFEQARPWERHAPGYPR